jgi:hypothetical protein
MRSLLLTAALIGLICVPTGVGRDHVTGAAVAEARRVNPQVRGARFRWESAKHQIIQNYTPSDPQFSFTDSDSWRGFLAGSGAHNVTVMQTLQLPPPSAISSRARECVGECI